MKKLLVLALAVLLVMGVSAVGLAADHEAKADVGVNVTVAEYFDVWFATPTDYKGLFAQNEDSFSETIGKPGIYVSDGNATKDFAVDYFWAEAIDAADDYGISAEVNSAYFAEGQLPGPMVELFKVDANTEVDVTLSADWTEWMNAPTMLRVSSDEGEINGYGDWDTELAVIGNPVEEVNNEDYNDLLGEHNTAIDDVYDDTFSLDFADELLCSGPIDFHLNGALWMPKASQVAADDYSATVTVTVAATNN